jgi:hypothetical protein
MKYLLIASVLSNIFLGCSSGGKLTYDFEMTYPAQSKELYYENDTMSISFDMQPKYIQIELYNKTNEGIKISWDDVSLSWNGEAYRVIHGETGIAHFTEVQPPTTIPPKAKLKDVLFTTDQVKSTYGLGAQKPTTYLAANFPEVAYNKKEKAEAMKRKGLKLTLFMPYYLAGKYISRYYEIYLRDVKVAR